MTDGWAWSPDGTQPVRSEDALRALPVDTWPDPSARRGGDLVLPSIPLGGDPRLAADAVTRWMDDDRARATPSAPPRGPRAPTGEGAARPAQRRDGAPRAAPPEPRAAPVPASPRGGRAVAWTPVILLVVMVIAIFLVVLSGGG